MLDAILSFLSADVSAKAVTPIIMAFVLGVLIAVIGKRKR